MNRLAYSFTKGFHDGNLLVYLPEEKHLYYKTNDRPSGQQDYACYEKILNKGHNCKSRFHLSADMSCWKNNVPHSDHENHELTFKDMQTLDDMRKKCRYIVDNFPSAHKIPLKEIFMSEMVK